MTLGMACQLAGDMNRFRLSVIGAALVAGQTLVAGCSPAEEMLPLTEVTASGSADKTGSSLDPIGTDVQQRVKNLCLEDL